MSPRITPPTSRSFRVILCDCFPFPDLVLCSGITERSQLGRIPAAMSAASQSGAARHAAGSEHFPSERVKDVSVLCALCSCLGALAGAYVGRCG